MRRRKARKYRSFGQMLEEGIKTLALRRNRRYGEAHRDLADELGVAGSTLYGWRRGEHLPPPDAVARLVGIFVEQGGMDERWFEAFLEKGEYGPPRAAEALRERLFGRAQGEGEKRKPSGNPVSVPETASSWTGRIFDRILILAEQFQAESFLKLAVGAGLWLATWGGVNRFFDWPFPDERTALAACFRYGLVGLGVPAGVSLLAGLDEQGIFKALPPADRRPLWVLRTAAAYIGYHLAMLTGAGIAIFLYSIGFSVAVWARAVLPVPALLLAYVFAREYPVRRMDARGERLIYFRETDDFVLGAFLLLAPLFAILFFFFYSDLLRPYWGSFLVGSALILAAGMALIEKRTGRMPVRWMMAIFLLPTLAFWLSVLVPAIWAWISSRGN